MDILNVFGWSGIEFVVFFCFFKRMEKVQLFELRKRMYIYYGILCIALAGICGCFIYARSHNLCETAKLMIVFIVLSIVAIIDYKIKLIPNKLVLMLLAVRIILLAPECFLYHEVFFDLIKNSFLNGIVIFIILFFLSTISKNGIGMGDVKLLSVMGVMLEIYVVLNVLILALVVCVLTAMLLVLSKKKNMKDKIPFGPFIFLGFIMTLLMGAY